MERKETSDSQKTTQINVHIPKSLDQILDHLSEPHLVPSSGYKIHIPLPWQALAAGFDVVEWQRDVNLIQNLIEASWYVDVNSGFL